MWILPHCGSGKADAANVSTSTVWARQWEDWNADEVLDNLYGLADSPVMRAELLELLRYQYDRIDFIDEPVDLGFDCPLDLHCTYTRDQLLVAMDFLKPATVREGVKWLPDRGLDVFFRDAQQGGQGLLAHHHV